MMILYDVYQWKKGMNNKYLNNRYLDTQPLNIVLKDFNLPGIEIIRYAVTRLGA